VFRADVGITGADYAVAESGTIAVFSNPRQPRLASLAPPVHIALIDASQILRTLFDLFDALADKPGCLPGETTNDRAAGGTLPSNLTLITGPSKTGDIELRLTTGVHGPGHLHVVVVEESGLGVS
jgi:L-lactate dehydrogenase complex protein LldG